MERATQDGTCQVCGRRQAAIKSTQPGMADASHHMAKHGYTVDYGYFNGTCSGSDRAPIELRKYVTEATIEGMEREIPVLAAKTAADIVRVPHTKYVMGKQRVEWLTRQQFDEMVAADAKHRMWKWEDSAERAAAQLRHQAKMMQDHVAFLRRLIETRHGQPLFTRKQDSDVERKEVHCHTLREAYAEASKLQAEGYKTRVLGGGMRSFAPKVIATRAPK